MTYLNKGLEKTQENVTIHDGGIIRFNVTFDRWNRLDRH